MSLKPKCPNCGGHDISVESWSRWDNEKKEFVHEWSHMHDDSVAYCHTCEEEITEEWVDESKVH